MKKKEAMKNKEIMKNKHQRKINSEEQIQEKEPQLTTLIKCLFLEQINLSQQITIFPRKVSIISKKDLVKNRKIARIKGMKNQTNFF